MYKGTVIKSTGSWYWVRLDGGEEVVRCRLVGKLRIKDDLPPLTNPIAVGDIVSVKPDAHTGDYNILMVEDRRNYVLRQSPRKKHDMHLLAANIDQAVLIVTVVQPNLKTGFIDRFLVMLAKNDIPVTIVFNKADLYDTEDMEVYETVGGIYEKIGYDTLLTSVVKQTGLDAFQRLLKDKLTLISGQSGVGKSSLVNAVQPQLDLRTGEISDYSGKGQHTTTFAEMHPLTFGGYLIDTPGIKTLSFNDRDLTNIAHSFREMFALSPNCKFGGSCLHRNEPGCAVKAALREGEVSELRYISYLNILEETESQNYWERHRETRY